MKDRQDKLNRLRARASLTVEAALVFPIFLFVIIGFLYFIQLLLLQERIQSAITEVSKFASRYGYVYERIMEYEAGEGEQEEEVVSKEDHTIIEGLIDGTIFQIKFLDYMGEDSLNDRCIVGGIQGVSFLESSFMREDSEVDVVAIYRVKIPVLFFRNNPFTVVQRVKTRAFVGLSCDETKREGESNEAEGEERQVYITKGGAKYHDSPTCTYLKMKVSKVTVSALDSIRNQSGGKYYPCESCLGGKRGTEQEYYITAYGDRYHASKECSKIDRTVITIPFSQIGSRTPCSKCGK